MRQRPPSATRCCRRRRRWRANTASIWAAEDALLITDLFPAAANRGKYQILFFKDPATLRAYEALKAQKRELLDAGRYAGAAREGIARAFGRLLSYDDASNDAYLAANADRE